MKTLKPILILSFILITQLSLIQAQQNVKNKALLVAAQANDIEQVKELVGKGADVNVKDIVSKYNYNNTPLHYACENKNGLEIAKLLIEKGANIHAKNKYDETPLHYVCKNKNGLEIAKLLIEKGANVNAKFFEKSEYNPGSTPLHFALQYKNNEIAKLLIEKGADINEKISVDSKYYSGYTPLCFACQNKNGLEIAKLLVEKGANVNVKDKNGKTAIHLACQNKDGIELVNLLIEKGVDINTKISDNVDKYNNPGFTALHFACENEKGFEIAKSLIEKGANLNAKDKNGNTALYFSLNDKIYEIAHLLIEKGADVNVIDEDGYTPLLLAIEDENIDIVKALIEKGAEINILIEDYTPLILAIETENIKIIKLLIGKGADLNAKNKEGQTPLLIALDNENNEIAQLLINKGAEINTNDKSYINTLLFSAIKSNNIEIVKLLIEKRADVNIKDANNANILMWAAYYGNLQLVKYLISIKANYNYKKGVIYLNYNKTSYYGNLLGIAAGKNKLDLLKYFVENLNIDIEDKEFNPKTEKADGWNALQWSASQGHKSVIEYLLNKEADINANSGSEMNTPLNIAISFKKYKTAKLLINKGADVNIQNADGWTPLMYAGYNENMEVFKLLLEKGANTKLKNNKGEVVWDIHEKRFGRKPLVLVLENKNATLVKLFIEKGADINTEYGRTDYGSYGYASYTPLTYALVNKNDSLAKFLIEKGADIKVRINGNKLHEPGIYTPFLYTLLNENIKLSKLLIKNGANVSTKFPKYSTKYSDFTPIQFALKNKNLELSKLLIEYGADINIKDGLGDTLLHIASWNKDEELIRLLVKEGVDINAKDYSGETLLHLTCKKENGFEAAKILIENGATIYISGEFNEDIVKSIPVLKYSTKLFETVKKNSLEQVKELIKKGADVNSKNKYNETPLLLALKNKNIKIAKLLIENGANINVKNEDGYTPLMEAINNKNSRIVNLLIKEGADVNFALPETQFRKDYIGWTALHFAAKDNNLKLTLLLFENNADTSLLSSKGLKPITIAENYGSSEIVLFLSNPNKYKLFALYQSNKYNELIKYIKKNPNLLNIHNSKKLTLLHLIIRDNKYDLLKKLISQKGIINNIDGYGNSLLTYSILLKRFDIAKLLIKKGADVNLTNDKGYTPLYLSKKYDYKELEKILVKNGANNTNIKPALIIPNGHSDNVTSVCYSPDNKTLLSSSKDNTIKLWEIKSNKLINTFIGHKDAVNTICFNKEGNFILSGSNDNTLKVWDVITGQEILTLTGHNKPISFAAFSYDDKYIISDSDDGTIRIWDINTSRQIKVFNKQNLKSYIIKNTQDGIHVISKEADSTIQITNLLNKENSKIQLGHKTNFNQMIISSDNKYLCTTHTDSTIKIWDLSTNKEINTLEGLENHFLWSFSRLNDRYILSLRNNDTIIIKDAFSGSEIIKMTKNTSRFSYYHYSKDRRFFAKANNNGKYLLSSFAETWQVTIGSYRTDKEIGIWNISTGREIKLPNQDSISFIDISSDDKFLIVGFNSGNIKFLELKTESIVKSFSGNSKLIDKIAQNKASDLYIYTSGDLNIKSVKPYYLDPDNSNTLNIKKTNRDSIVKIWDLFFQNFMLKNYKDKKMVGSYHGRMIPFKINSSDNKYKVSVSKNGQLIRVGSRSFRILDNMAESIHCVNFTHDNKYLLMGSNLGEILIWNLQHKRNHITNEDDFMYSHAIDRSQAIWKIRAGNQRVTSLIMTADGNKIISGHFNKTIHIWDFHTGKKLKEIKGHSGHISFLGESPNGKILLSGATDNTIKLWDISTGKLLKTLKGHSNSVTFASYISGMNYILSSSMDETTKVWDAKSGKELANIIFIDSTDWAITTPEGLFDASPDAMRKMHYVSGMEVIELTQLKDRFYEPGLLSKILKGESLRNVQGLNKIDLPPDIKLLPIKNNKLNIELKNKSNGGIGQVKVFINGKEIIEDARIFKNTSLAKMKNMPKIDFNIDLTKYDQYFIPGKDNMISVQAYNGEDYIISRPELINYIPEVPKGYDPDEIPDVYIVCIGVSDYEGWEIDLRFAAKDAEDMMTALKTSAEGLFGKEKVHSFLLTSPLSERKDVSQIALPTKGNIEAGFFKLSQKIDANDILIVYLAGHGINIAPDGGEGDFYYLTSDAYSGDVSAYFDKAIRNKTTVKSSEFVKMLTKQPANKQVLIIDACHSGKAVESLSTQRDMPSSTIRAFDRMRDRTGMHIITGSTANAVSYESNRFGQGILTYSLLEGIKGTALREGKFVDVIQLFQKSKERVPVLAEGLGGIQVPVIFSPYLTGKFDKGAESFDIGKLTKEDKAKIPLAKSKPMFVMSMFQDADNFADLLDLGEKTDEKLRELTAIGAKAPLILIETRDFPGAYKIRGQYTSSDNKIFLKVKIFEGKTVKKSIELSSDKNNIDELIQKLINKMLEVIGK